MKKRLLITVGLIIFSVTMTACEIRGNTNNIIPFVSSSPTPKTDEALPSTEIETVVSVGEIWLVSAGEQYAPFENWIYSLDKDGLAADGERKQPKDIINELEIISVYDDVQIVIDGQATDLQYYTLYDEQYQEIYYRQEKFMKPEKPGKYILSVEVVWGNEAYDGYQYIFILEKHKQSWQKLSELSEAECLEFISSRDIEIPDVLNTPHIGELVKQMIADAEKYPQSGGLYSATYTNNLSEAVRKAVNEYYGVDGTGYLFIEEP